MKADKIYLVGFMAAGKTTVARALARRLDWRAIDIDEACRFPYEQNNGAPFLRKDVGNLTAKDIEDLFIPGVKRVLVGCAPCQPFST